MTRKLRSLLGVFFVATLVALAFRFVLLEDFRISSESMYPTLYHGDLVFVSKSAFNVRLPFTTYQLFTVRQPKRGEVVAFSLPESLLDTFVKRVVALEGDNVSIVDGVLKVNNVPAEYQQANEGSEGKIWMEQNPWAKYPVRLDRSKKIQYGPVDVPKDHFFALGDNREDSVDSRTWGPIPLSCLKGRVALVWLSVKPAGGLARDRIGLWVQ